jgi:hypothetical protein
MMPTTCGQANLPGPMRTQTVVQHSRFTKAEAIISLPLSLGERNNAALAPSDLEEKMALLWARSLFSTTGETVWRNSIQISDQYAKALATRRPGCPHYFFLRERPSD